MEDIVRLIVGYLHVTAGLLWIGGGFYTILVQGPALMATPPQARGPALAQIAPRQVFYLLRLGELTIVTGVLRILTSGRSREIEDLSSRWTLAILVGALLAVVLLVIGHAILKPAITRLLTLGPKAAQGDGSAAAEAGAIVKRLTTIGYVQLALGFTIVFGMVLACLS
ncbi:MAG: hypothetical protein Q7S25_03865 [Candidatus Limnocylindria bacterium]|nr:hypothetical protein [Candidatus Limnocylindria bacterium]